MKEIKQELVWHSDVAGNHPPDNLWYLVWGYIINRGRKTQVTRIVYHEKGKGFIDNDDMEVAMWAELPRP